VNEELRQLYEADQADRLASEMPRDFMERDHARLRRVTELLDAGAAESGEDFFHAAMVFQHGDDVNDYQRAHELALRAAELGHRPGRWLAAAARDRWLMRQGKPQKYGTQYRASGDRMELYEVDPATTDEERAEWDVPSLAEALRRAEDMAQTPRRVAGGFAGPPAVTFQGGDLEFHIHVLPAEIGPSPRMPRPTPLQDGDPVPSWLPAGLIAGRAQYGFAAADEAGDLRMSWFRPSRPLAIGWREQDGPVPQPEAIEVAGGTGIWCRIADGWSLLAFVRPGGRPWVVAGKGPREELARVAESLP
jgi:TPR repeat protein